MLEYIWRLSINPDPGALNDLGPPFSLRGHEGGDILWRAQLWPSADLVETRLQVLRLHDAIDVAFSLLMIASEVPAGATTPNHSVACSSGKPLSTVVGTAGS